MHEFEDFVLATVDGASLIMSLAPPQKKHDALFALINHLNDLVSELLPPFFLMRVRQSLPHSQDCVQEEHTLIGPFSQVTMDRVRHFKVNLRVLLKCLIDVLETWWTLNVFRY